MSVNQYPSSQPALANGHYTYICIYTHFGVSLFSGMCDNRGKDEGNLLCAENRRTPTERAVR